VVGPKLVTLIRGVLEQLPVPKKWTNNWLWLESIASFCIVFILHFLSIHVRFIIM
jgi:hypothetical protein